MKMIKMMMMMMTVHEVITFHLTIYVFIYDVGKEALPSPILTLLLLLLLTAVVFLHSTCSCCISQCFHIRLHQLLAIFVSGVFFKFTFILPSVLY